MADTSHTFFASPVASKSMCKNVREKKKEANGKHKERERLQGCVFTGRVDNFCSLSYCIKFLLKYP